MVYSDQMIFEWVTGGGVREYDINLINPASIDLRLGKTYRHPELLSNDYHWSEPITIPEEGLLVRKNDFILCHTIEWISMPIDAVGKLFLKSTTGRRGLEHLHAGYIDPGFEGILTLELYSHWPGSIILRPYERLVQLTVESCGEVSEEYKVKGHYQYQTGPTLPSLDCV